VGVSLTGEGEWHEAQLQAPRGPYHWQGWSFDWDATHREVPPWKRLGYGNNAIEVIYVDVC
jgi:hypothetical protein